MNKRNKDKELTLKISNWKKEYWTKLALFIEQLHLESKGETRIIIDIDIPDFIKSRTDEDGLEKEGTTCPNCNEFYFIEHHCIIEPEEPEMVDDPKAEPEASYTCEHCHQEFPEGIDEHDCKGKGSCEIEEEN